MHALSYRRPRMAWRNFIGFGERLMATLLEEMIVESACQASHHYLQTSVDAWSTDLWRQTLEKGSWTRSLRNKERPSVEKTLLRKTLVDTWSTKVGRPSVDQHFGENIGRHLVDRSVDQVSTDIFAKMLVDTWSTDPGCRGFGGFESPLLCGLHTCPRTRSRPRLLAASTAALAYR